MTTNVLLDRPQGLISQGNQSTTVLGASATFTGAAEQNFYPDVMTSCFSSSDGTLFYDFSINGADWRTFPVNGFAVHAGIHEFHTAVKGPRYFRVRFVNSSTAQTKFQLATYYGVFRQGNLPLNANIGQDADAAVVRSVDPKVDLAIGRISGMEELAKHGFNGDIDTASTPEHVWTYGGVRTSPTSSFTPFIASDSASDTDVTMTVNYLDANGERQSLDIALNGQTPVSLGVTATECTRTYIADVSNNALAGDVAVTTANNFTSGAPDNQNEVLAYVTASYEQTQIAADRVPTGYKYHIKHLLTDIVRASGAAGSAEVHLQTRVSGGHWRSRRVFQIQTGGSISTPISGLTLDAGTDIRGVVVSVSDNNTAVSMIWNYDLVRM